MQPGKKTISLFLPVLAMFTLLLAACGGNSSAPAATGSTKAAANQQIFIDPVGGVTDIATFDPALSTDADSINAIDMVYTGLVQLDDKLNVVDQLAASHVVSTDGLTWTFTLKPNLKFSDGNPLTSQDVVYSINRALTPSVKSTVSPIYLALVKDSDKMLAGKISTLIGDSLLAPDPNTVIIKTSKAASYFLDALTYSCSYVVEKSLIDKYGQTGFTDHLTEGGGDGPFTVSKYAHSKEIDFVPNTHYYGKQPQLKKVVFPFYKEADTVYKVYQVNQVDAAAVPTAQLAGAKALPNHQFHQVPQLWIAYISMNYLVKPFDNIKIRQAFALAIDKDVIAHNIRKDTRIASNHIVPSGMPGYNPNLTGPDGVTSTKGDPTKAKQLFQQGLQEEGYTSVSQLPAITYTISTSGSATARNESAAIQQMWQTVLGVNVKLNDIDFNQLLVEVPQANNNAKGLQMWSLGWIADYPDAQDWLTLQFDKGVPNNSWNYGQNSSSDAAQQQAVQQTLEQADVNQNPTERLQQYNQAEQQLINDVAWIPIDQVTAPSVLKPCIKGIVDNSQALTPPDDWGNIYKSTDTPCANVSSYQ